MDESSVSMLPVVRSTWAPKGQTPVLSHRGSWKRFSVAGYAAYRLEPDVPEAQRARFCFALTPDSYTTESFCEALTGMHAELGGGVTLILDKASIHKSAEAQEFFASQDWLTVLFVPGYSPDLQPVEGTWAAYKTRDLANHCAKNLAELEHIARAGLTRIRFDRQLLIGCLAKTGLTLETTDARV